MVVVFVLKRSIALIAPCQNLIQQGMAAVLGEHYQAIPVHVVVDDCHQLFAVELLVDLEGVYHLMELLLGLVVAFREGLHGDEFVGGDDAEGLGVIVLLGVEGVGGD